MSLLENNSNIKYRMKQITNKTEILNQLKNTTKNIVLSMFSAQHHNVEQIELEAILILYLKKLFDDSKKEYVFMDFYDCKLVYSSLESKTTNFGYCKIVISFESGNLQGEINLDK